MVTLARSISCGAAGVAALLVTACTSPTQTPTTPAPQAPTVSRIVVEGLSSPSTVGATMQLSATIVFETGTRKDATTSVIWQSSDESIGTITAGGFLTIVGFGDADISATLAGRTGTARVAVPKPIPPRPSYEIAGVVHERAPTTDVLVTNARVEVVGETPLAGQIFSTDGEGRFRLPPVQDAGFAIKFKRPGYEDHHTDIVYLPRDEHLDIALSPERKIIQRVWEGVISCPVHGRADGRDLSFPVHHTGPISFQEVRVQSFEGANIVALYKGSQRLYDTYCDPLNPCTAPLLEAGFVYRLIVATDCVYDHPRFRVVFSQPN